MRWRYIGRSMLAIDEELIDEPTVVSELRLRRLHQVYVRMDSLTWLYAPAWITVWLAPLLRMRDAAARDWFQHYRMFYTVPRGGQVPWPRCLRFGWEI